MTATIVYMMKKLAEACQHSVPVLVPCDGCREQRIEKIYKAAVDESLAEWTEKNKGMRGEIAEIQAALMGERLENAKLRRQLSELQKAKAEAAAAIAAKDKVVRDLDSRLAAEQALKSTWIR